MKPAVAEKALSIRKRPPPTHPDITLRQFVHLHANFETAKALRDAEDDPVKWREVADEGQATPLWKEEAAAQTVPTPNAPNKREAGPEYKWLRLFVQLSKEEEKARFLLELVFDFLEKYGGINAPTLLVDFVAKYFENRGGVDEMIKLLQVDSSVGPEREKPNPEARNPGSEPPAPPENPENFEYPASQNLETSPDYDVDVGSYKPPPERQRVLTSETALPSENPSVPIIGVALTAADAAAYDCGGYAGLREAGHLERWHAFTPTQRDPTTPSENAETRLAPENSNPDDKLSETPDAANYEEYRAKKRKCTAIARENGESPALALPSYARPPQEPRPEKRGRTEDFPAGYSNLSPTLPGASPGSPSQLHPAQSLHASRPALPSPSSRPGASWSAQTHIQHRQQPGAQSSVSATGATMPLLTSYSQQPDRWLSCPKKPSTSKLVLYADT